MEQVPSNWPELLRHQVKRSVKQGHNSFLYEDCVVCLSSGENIYYLAPNLSEPESGRNMGILLDENFAPASLAGTFQFTNYQIVGNWAFDFRAVKLQAQDGLLNERLEFYTKSTHIEESDKTYHYHHGWLHCEFGPAIINVGIFAPSKWLFSKSPRSDGAFFLEGKCIGFAGDLEAVWEAVQKIGNPTYLTNFMALVLGGDK